MASERARISWDITENSALSWRERYTFLREIFVLDGLLVGPNDATETYLLCEVEQDLKVLAHAIVSARVQLHNENVNRGCKDPLLERVVGAEIGNEIGYGLVVGLE